MTTHSSIGTLCARARAFRGFIWRKRPLNPGFAWFFAFALFWPFVRHSTAQNFEAEGRITYTVFGGGAGFAAETSSMSFTNRFWVAVDGCRYKISVDQGNGNRCEAAFDSGELYEFFTMKSGSNDSYTCLIDTNSIPPDDGRTLNYLWLAYASSCYFSAVKTNRLTPIWMLDDPDLLAQSFSVQASWQTESDLPHLPVAVFYLSDGIHRALSSDKRHIEFRYPPPFAQGFTNAVYTALATKVVGTLVLPTRFVFTRYYVQDPQHLSVLNVTEGDALSLREGTAKPPFRPSSKGQVFVIDKRFRGSDKPVPVISYHVTNGNWPTLAELRPLYTKKLSRDLMARNRLAGLPHGDLPVRFWRGVMIAVIVAPLLALAVGKLKHKNKKTYKGQDRI